MNLKIAVAHHKRGQLLYDPELIHVHAGKSLSTEVLDMYSDNEGDNISEKNPWYCELTVLYWLWKNVDADYKGLIHYRRTFTDWKMGTAQRMLVHLKYKQRRFSAMWSNYSSTGVTYTFKYKTREKFQKANRRFLDKAKKCLSNGVNVIAAYPVHFYSQVRVSIGPVVSEMFINQLEDIVREKHPDFYPYFKEAQEGIHFHNANMHVMDRKTHDEYCSLMFDILAEHERRVVAEGYLKDIAAEKCYSRMSGYLGELITNAFVRYSMKTKKVKLLPIAIFRP